MGSKRPAARKSALAGGHYADPANLAKVSAPPSTEPAPVAPAEPGRTVEEPKQAKPVEKKAAAPSPRSAPAGTENIAIWFRPATLKRAQAAYQVDEKASPEQTPDSFRQWLSDAARELADMSSERRIAAVRDADAEQPGRGSSRMFHIDSATLEAIEQARADDERQLTIKRSRGEFIVLAARVATARARQRYVERTGAQDLPEPEPLRLGRPPKK
ncbi:hypothetical protein [Luteipulveratus halotolerans]|uniref:Uncharacterized protein n=1 Tax=Luteipulveratus halotolerans TaxID=1631356 RepID=A0A0L6CQ68_9MICO|nr:hypothetical protein [Luteipulveratus halotolerans]KNX39683.1 hypothetical protein VV01_00145 [Luteipulveratus halotolerans]